MPNVQVFANYTNRLAGADECSGLSPQRASIETIGGTATYEVGVFCATLGAFGAPLSVVNFAGLTFGCGMGSGPNTRSVYLGVVDLVDALRNPGYSATHDGDPRDERELLGRSYVAESDRLKITDTGAVMVTDADISTAGLDVTVAGDAQGSKTDNALYDALNTGLYCGVFAIGVSLLFTPMTGGLAGGACIALGGLLTGTGALDELRRTHEDIQEFGKNNRNGDQPVIPNPQTKLLNNFHSRIEDDFRASGYSSEETELLLDFSLLTAKATPSGIVKQKATFGDEELIGTTRADYALGGIGDNTINTRSGADAISAGNGNDSIVAGSGSDIILAGRGGDTVFGGRGHDTMEGFNGKDYLKGGRGNDFLIGGKGADQFIFGKDHGRDVIEDFTAGRDIIVILGGADGFDDLRISETRSGNARIINEDTRIVLKDVDKSDLDTGDFLFL